MLDTSDDKEEDSEEKKDGDNVSKDTKKKKKASDGEGARLIERFRKELKKLEEGDYGEEEKDEKEEDLVMDAMGLKNSATTGELTKNLASSKLDDSPSPTKSKPPSSASSSSSRSSGGPPPKKPSNHPASVYKTEPVTSGMMSGMPKYQYYQDDNFMKVQILEAGVTADNLTVDFTPDDLTVKIKKQESTGMTEYTVIHGDLYEEVVPDKCRAIIKAEKVLIKLKKKESKLEWNTLLDESKAGDRKKGRVEKRMKENGEVKDGEDGDVTPDEEKAANKTAIPTVKGTKNRPYASHRDWDAIDKSLEEELNAEKPEGDEALNTLFKQIYANADEDTRRAMVKSMQTSGGTTLSTNWDEVGKTGKSEAFFLLFFFIDLM